MRYILNESVIFYKATFGPLTDTVTEIIMLSSARKQVVIIYQAHLDINHIVNQPRILRVARNEAMYTAPRIGQ